MPEYTVAAVVAAVAVVLLELRVLRTGLFRRGGYWITLAIVFAFQVAVDGWLTKLSAPIVRYDDVLDHRGPGAVGHPGGGLRLRVRPAHPGAPAVERAGQRAAAGTT